MQQCQCQINLHLFWHLSDHLSTVAILSACIHAIYVMTGFDKSQLPHTQWQGWFFTTTQFLHEWTNNPCVYHCQWFPHLLFLGLVSRTCLMCLSVWVVFKWQWCDWKGTHQAKRQLAELPAILDIFYTIITNDHIGVEVRGHGEPQRWHVFPHVEVDTARRSHLRPIQALDITNNSQFDGQAFCPVLWRFP